METQAASVVLDQTGQRGWVEQAQLANRQAETIRVHFADQQVLVPVELLTQQADGTFYLPLALADLLEQTKHISGSAGETLILPVIAEELRIKKQTVETGVRITKLVHETQESYNLPLLSEEVEIKRVPINRRVEQPTAVRQEGDVLIVPLFEEVLVVQKQLLLKEEVHIITKRTETHQTGQEVLRHEEILVEPLNDQSSPPVDFSDSSMRNQADV